MTRSEMREHVFKLIFRVPFHDKNELREQIDYYFDGLTDVNEKDYEYIKNKLVANAQPWEGCYSILLFMSIKHISFLSQDAQMV